MHTTQDLATFCKRKGFIYQSSEIYGSMAGFYDYGHLGTALKRNFENIWRNYFLSLNDNFHEIETAQIMHENTFHASGHLANFTDPVAICQNGHFERADHLLEAKLSKRFEGLNCEEMKSIIDENQIKCQTCGLEINEVKKVNMMFPIELGVGKTTTAYLRPETAQSPYVNFKLQHEILRKKMPLGLALIGKAFRNEISPRNLTLRQREFTQAELQIFFDPQTIEVHPDFESVKDYALRVMLVDDREANMVVERSAQTLVQEGLPEFYVYHLVKIQQFYLEVLGHTKEKFRLYQLNDSEKAFYNKYHFDLELEMAHLGWVEVGGLHYRTDHDLKGHQEISKVNMEVLDEASGRKYIPHVLECSFGVDRNVYGLLDLNYEKDEERGNIVLHLPKSVTPFECAVFPLVKNKPELMAKASEVYALLKDKFSCFFDESSSVGRRYARADEIGVRYCVTIDFESLEDDCVTIRDRETTNQTRVKVDELVKVLHSM